MSYRGKRVQDKLVGGGMQRTIRKQIEEDNGDGGIVKLSVMERLEEKGF